MFFKKKKKKDEVVEEKEEKTSEEADEQGEASSPDLDEDNAPKTEENPEGDAPKAPAKKSKKKLIIIGAVAGVLLLGAIGFAVYHFVFSVDEGAKIQADPKDMEANKPIYFDMPQLLVNLNTGGKSASFIKATVTLQLENSTDVAAVQANLPKLIDNYNTFLREMKATDLYGSAGIYRLREEMLMRANQLLTPVKVKDVLFREILVQ